MSPRSPAVLIVALSGRALAASACRAGRRALVLDLFNDQDTEWFAWRSDAVSGSLADGLCGEALLRRAAAICAPEGSNEHRFVYGAGFEDRPELLRQFARGYRLLGNRPEVVQEVKDPRRFFARLRDLGIPHPSVRFTRPASPAGWLAKRSGASGGWHVRPASSVMPTANQDYYQRRADGRTVSALFLGDGRDAIVLGLSEQWRAQARSGLSYGFGGAVQPAMLAPALSIEIAGVTASLVADFGLVGLNSADFLVRDDGFDLLEVNPRPGATLDIFDLDPEAPLFALHEAACLGELPDRWQPRSVAKACALVYAPADIGVVTTTQWPDWAADLPRPGSAMAAGAPVCTLLAEAETAARARAAVEARVDAILRWLEGGGLDASLERGAAAGRDALVDSLSGHM